MAVVLIAGSSGFIGQTLSSLLIDRGDRVLHLVRRTPRGPGEFRWDPVAGTVDERAFDGVDTVINLCGANVGEARWTRGRRDELRASRIEPAHLLAKTCARARVPALLNASAIGFYGDRGDEILDERSPSGGGFLADLCVAWEHALRPAEEAGVRVVRMRMGMVLDMHGGVLPWMSLAFKACLGGPVGTGEQWIPWISRHDAVHAFAHIVDNRLVSGPVVAVSPGGCRQKEFAEAMGRALHRPAWLRLPAKAVSLFLGERGRELLLHSQRCRPSVLTDSAFVWKHVEIGPTLQKLL